MGGIKTWAADKWFSKCIRCRVNWVCENCGTDYSNNHQGLDASHWIGRGNWSTRFDPDNVFAHCTACHFHLGSDPHAFNQFVLAQLGERRMEIVTERKNDTSIGRAIKKANKKRGRQSELSNHFQEEFLFMEGLRKEGHMDRIEFEGWDYTPLSAGLKIL